MAQRRGKPGRFRRVILLDTNVMSALMQNEPARHVVRWLDRQPVSEIWLPSVVVFELRYGLGIMPEGSRRERLEQGLNSLLDQLVSG
jgi:predicted nucleic acid-binding protein